MAELKEIFGHFDKNNNGVIESGELSGLLDALGADMTEAEVQTGLSALDHNGNGTIEFEEFAAWWVDRT